MSVGSELKRLGLISIYSFLDRDPEKNLPKLINWLDRYVSPDVLPTQRQFFRDVIEKKDSHWYQLILSLWEDVDPDLRKTLFENIVINANALAAHRAEESRRKYDCNIPWVISIELGEDEDSLDFDQWDDVIEQAKELGTFAFMFEGGEPLDHKEEIIALCNKHSECEFMIFTSGEKMDEDFAKQVLRVRNLIVTIKISGMEALDKAGEAISVMRKNKLLYATMSLYDKENQEEIAREEFFDRLQENGVKFAFFASSLTEKEDVLYDAIKAYRSSKAIATLDFCKDISITKGCVGGGKYYCHINAKGDVEPCFLLSDSDTNVTRKPLVEAYKAPMFKTFRGYYGESACVED